MLVQYNSVFVPLCSPNTCKNDFNPIVTTFQSNFAEGLHFSAFHFILQYYIIIIGIHMILYLLECPIFLDFVVVIAQCHNVNLYVARYIQRSVNATLLA